MRQIIEIAIDVENRAGVGIADAGTIGLTHAATADDDHRFGLLHGIVAADRPLRSTNVHVLCVTIHHHAGRAGGQNYGQTCGLSKRAHSFVMGARAAACFDDDFGMAAHERDRFVEGAIIGRRLGWKALCRRQCCKVNLRLLRLRVDRQHDEERASLIGMMHASCAAAHTFAQGPGRVKRVGLPHQRAHFAKDPLLRLGDLLHIVALPVRRFIAVDVINTDAIRGRSERACHRLQPTRADRGDNRRGFAMNPSVSGRGMRHFHFIAAVDDRHSPHRVINAQNLAQIGRAMSEDRIELSDALLEHRHHQRFGQGQIDDTAVVGRCKSVDTASGNLGRADVHFMFGLCGFKSDIKHRIH